MRPVAPVSSRTAYSFRLGDPISHTRLRDDDARIIGVSLDFLTQVPNVDAQVLSILRMRGSPHGSENLPVGHDLAGVPCKKRQELEFLWRQLHLFVRARHATTKVVDLNLLDSQNRYFILPPHAMPQRRPHPCHQLAHAERLVDEIVCPQIQGFDLFGFPVPRGKHDNGHVGPWPNFSDHILAVTVGQAEVEHNDIRRIGCDPLGRLRHGSGADNVIVIGLKRRLEETQDSGFIIDNEDAGLGSHARVSSRGNVRTMRVPRPSAIGLSAATAPPCASMMPFAMAKPRPAPSPPSALTSLRFMRTNFSNT